VEEIEMTDAIEEIILEAEEKMSKSIEHFKEELAGFRTGKASPALVENIRVQYYGSQVKLRELATISTPEPRLIVINAYDPTSLPEIEKAILSANIGITPVNDGRVIRLPIPELSMERRNELVKLARKRAEDTRVAIRNIRRDANEHIKKLEKSKEITEDEMELATKQIQDNTDKFMAQIDEILSAKEKDILGS
jgi:ribosome recycling factor